MSREIFYEYSASAIPPDPTVNSTKYVAPLAYATGYYKAIARENGDLSTVTSTSFGMSPTDYIRYYPLIADFSDSVGGGSLTNYGCSVDSNGCLFNQNTDLLVMPSYIDSSDLSVSLKCNFSSLSNNVILNGESVDYNMLTIRSSKLAFYSNAHYVSSKTLSINTEYKIVLVKSSTNVKIYVDGELVLDNNNGISNTTERFKNIGNVGTGQQLYSANGLYKDIKIFNRVLSESEIGSL